MIPAPWNSISCSRACGWHARCNMVGASGGREIVRLVGASPVVAQAAGGWPQSSNREIVWGQRRRPRTDRHAEDPPPETLRGAGAKVMSGGAVKAVPR